MSMPGRKYEVQSGYRFGFNGKEKDKDINYGDLDFGARIYNERVGRWLSVDPLQKKFPEESPYIFSGNGPIAFKDPDGQEKIVATAGLNRHEDTNPMMFIAASKLVLKQYVEQAKKAGNNETVTWIIYDFDYTPKQKREFEKWAKKNGVAPPIYVKTADNLVNYLNNKDINTDLPSGNNISDAREIDKVTSLTIASHGVASTVAFGLENGGPENVGNVAESDFNVASARKLDKEAFDNAIIQFYSCNSGTAEEVYVSQNARYEFPSVQELEEYNTSRTNLVSVMAEVTQSKVSGIIGSCLYRTGAGQLPTSGKTKQTVNGKQVKSIPVTIDNRNNQ